MNRDIRESLLKSFALFFGSMSTLAALLFYGYYAKMTHHLEERIQSQMRQCSFDLACDAFTLGFIPVDAARFYLIEHNAEGLHGYYPIGASDRFMLKLTYAHDKFERDIDAIVHETLLYLFAVLALLALLSALFSLYALSPLRRALLLTREFVRDIIHDINTPLSVLRLNVALLSQKEPHNPKHARMESAIAAILELQENMRSYLDATPPSRSVIDLGALCGERLMLIEKLYPHIRFSQEGDSFTLHSDPAALSRIIDNLLTNAAKYNRPEGSVHVRLDSARLALHVSDSGSGIKEPKKVFERFYSEHPQGRGIGLHIVKKLCDALGVTISLHSTVGEGSTFSLDLKSLSAR